MINDFNQFSHQHFFVVHEIMHENEYSNFHCFIFIRALSKRRAEKEEKKKMQRRKEETRVARRQRDIFVFSICRIY